MPASDDPTDGARTGTPPSSVDPVELPHGVAVGDVTPQTAVFWTRTAEPATVHVEYATTPDFSDSTRATPAAAQSTTDNTAKIRVAGLDSNTTYHYRLWAYQGRGAAEGYDPPESTRTGSFTTPPAPDTSDSVSLVWSGDTFGQGRWPPYKVFEQMVAHEPDTFLYLGDTIYADSESPAVPDGDPEGLADYRAKYKENRAKCPHLRDLLASTNVVSIWDDHEVENDWAGSAHPLMPAGRQAFFEYWPIDEHTDVTGDRDHRLYRSFRYGNALELIVLDERQYRDKNVVPDNPTKTMLGDHQREWLKSQLANSDATFTLVASSTSICSVSSDPHERDGWASGDSNTGFEHELQDIVDHIDSEVDSTVVFLTGDRHCARMASYDPDRDGTPEFHEVMATPIGAYTRDPEPIDDSFEPTLHYEEGGKYELGEFYNFGRVDVDGDTLTIGIYDKVGDCRAELQLTADGAWPRYEEDPDGTRAPNSTDGSSSDSTATDGGQPVGEDTVSGIAGFHATASGPDATPDSAGRRDRAEADEPTDTRRRTLRNAIDHVVDTLLGLWR